MKRRKSIQLDGIPITWETNLSESELREFYLTVLKAERDDNFAGTPNPLPDGRPYLSNGWLPFRDGYCQSSLSGNNLVIIYYTHEETLAFEKKRQRISLLRQYSELLATKEIQLQVIYDRALRKAAQDTLRRENYETTLQHMNSRAAIRREYKKHREKAPWMWNNFHETDFNNILASFPNTTVGLNFLRKHYPYGWRYSGFAFAWIFWRYSYHCEDHSSDWMLTGCYAPAPMPLKDCLDEVFRIFKVGSAIDPYNWIIHQDFAKIFEKHNDLDHAIQVCRQAIQRGLTEDTRTGFKGRLNRLKKNTARHTSDCLVEYRKIPQLRYAPWN